MLDMLQHHLAQRLMVFYDASNQPVLPLGGVELAIGDAVTPGTTMESLDGAKDRDQISGFTRMFITVATGEEWALSRYPILTLIYSKT